MKLKDKYLHSSEPISWCQRRDMASVFSLFSICFLSVHVVGSESKISLTSPRLKLSYQDLLTSNGLTTYRIERSCCYSTLLLDEERNRLFVGAKNFLASLNLDNISKHEPEIHWPAPVEWREECNWAGKDINSECMNFVKVLHPYNRTHLYACGTGAFHPICTYVEVGQRTAELQFRIDLGNTEDGKGKCPYDPKYRSASVLVGEELYSGVATDLMGRDFTIFRSLGHRNCLRTEQHDSRWLNEPKFVNVFWIPESNNHEDDKIYFFFRETAVESHGLGKVSYARIGQICRNDIGGQRSLVHKWTTFLKARLVCSVPGTDGSDTYFDELRDVFMLQTKEKRNPLIYAVFSTSSAVFKGSAVCLYTMNDIRRAFLGPFAHKQGPNYQWIPYQGKVPYPRPGTCPSKTFGTLESTKEFPDDVLQFARNHPLMYNPVYPVNHRPILIQTNADYTFTQIAVDRVPAADGQYDVMFIGTDIGTVLKVISVPRERWHHTEALLLEELQVFKDSTPVTNLELSSKRQQLYIGSDLGVSQLPLHRCSSYGKACAECCLARDPYCAWDGSSCTRYLHNTKRRFRRQDVRNGDPNTLCSGEPHKVRVLERKLYGVEGSSVFLECVPKSLQAKVIWTYQKPKTTQREELKTDEHILKTERGVLLRNIQRKDAGAYLCHAMEHGFTQTLLRYSIEVINSWQVKELTRKDGPNDPRYASQKIWYQDFLQLVDHPNLNTVDEICEQVWKRKNQQPKQRPVPPPLPAKAKPDKWKNLPTFTKARNRRMHEISRSDRAPRSAAIW